MKTFDDCLESTGFTEEEISVLDDAALVYQEAGASPGEALRLATQDAINRYDEQLASIEAQRPVPKSEPELFYQPDTLAMDKASRMARAEAMGFDTGTVYYHGTSDDIDTFRESKAGKAGGGGVYLTTGPTQASKYAKLAQKFGSRLGRGDNPNVVPVFVRMSNPFISETGMPYNANVAGLKNAGYDGIILKGEMPDGSDEVIIFDPANIRSVNAVFNPEKTDSSAILNQSVVPSKDIAGGMTEKEFITIDDLAGAYVFPIFADNAASGVTLKSIDGVELDPTDFYGGAGFPYLKEYRDKKIVWAVNKKGVLSDWQGKINAIKEHDPNARVVIIVNSMKPDAHVSNNMTVDATFSALTAYVREGRISDEVADTIYSELKAHSSKKDGKFLKDMPPLHPREAFVTWAKSVTFDDRKFLISKLSSAKIREMDGMFSLAKVIRYSADPEFSGTQNYDSLAAFELDVTDDAVLEFSKDDSVTKHPAYDFAITGKLVGTFKTKIPMHSMYRDLIKEVQDASVPPRANTTRDLLRELGWIREGFNEKGKPTWNFMRDLEDFPLTKEERKIVESKEYKDLMRKLWDEAKDGSTKYLLDRLATGRWQEITPEVVAEVKEIEKLHDYRVAQAHSSGLAGEWRESGKTKAKGGIAPIEFELAIAGSDYSPLLTQWKAKDAKGLKIFQLGSETVSEGGLDIWVALKEKFSFRDAYGAQAEHLYKSGELTDNEVYLTGLASNETAVTEASLYQVMKGIEEGATVVDAFKLPNSFIDLYATMGFEEIGVIPFDKSIYNKHQMADMKAAWGRDGWVEGDDFPSISVMKYRGTEDARTNATKGFVLEGIKGLGVREVRNNLHSASHVRIPDANGNASEGEQQPAGTSDGRNDRGDLPDTGQAMASRSREFIESILAAHGLATEALKIPQSRIEAIRESYKNTTLAQDNLASIQFTNGESIMRFTRAANRSSFLHEAGHLFLEMERKFAKEFGLTSEQQSMLDWLGAESFDSIDPRTTEGREMHEKFARGFERYLGEGKAPSSALRRVFASFRLWLTDVYRSLTRLNVELNDDIRIFFDSILASEEEIKAMRNEVSYEFFTDPRQAEMTPEEWAAWVQAKEDDAGKAQQTLDQKILVQLIKRTTKEWKAERKELADEIETDLKGKPEYIVAEETKANKLNTQEVMDALAEGYGLTELPKNLKKFTKKNGASLALASQNAQMQDVPNLLEVLDEIQTVKAAALELAQEEMIQKYGDILNDGTMEAEAMEAAHNEAHGKLLLEELKALSKGKPAIDRKVMRIQAREVLMALTPKQFKLRAYHSAEIKFAKKSQKALGEGDKANALKYKIQQLQNHYLFVEGMKLQDKAITLENRFKQIKKSKMQPVPMDSESERIRAEYNNKAKQITHAFDSRKPPQERKIMFSDLAEWYSGQGDGAMIFINEIALALEAKENGEPYDFPLKVYADLTLGERIELDDSITSLRFRANRLAKDASTLEADIDSLVASTEAEGGVDFPELSEGKSAGRATKDTTWKLFVGSLLSPRNLLRKLDGGKDDGAYHTLIWKQLEKATNDKIQIREELFDSFGKEFVDITSEDIGRVRGKVPVTLESGKVETLSSEGKFMLAMYWGTESSRTAIMEGHGYTENDVLAILSTLSTNQLEMVNAMWKVNESIWGRAVDQQMRHHGVAPPKLDPTPFTVNGVKMTGGHMRLYSAGERSDISMEVGINPSLSIPTNTQQGSMIARRGFGGQKVRLEKGNIARALEEAMHKIAFADANLAIGKLLNSKKVKAAITRKHGDVFLQQLAETINGTTGAVDTAEEYRPFAKALRLTRSAVVAKYLMGSIGNALEGALGGFNSMEEVGVQRYTKALIDVHKKGVIESIDEMSIQMKNRFQNISREAASNYGNYLPEGKARQAGRAIKQNGFILQVAVDRQVAYPLWLASYSKSMETNPRKIKDDGARQEQAIADADLVVRETIGSGMDIDLGRIVQSSNREWVRNMTSMMSWFNMINNKAMKRGMDPSDRAGLLRYVVMLMTTVIPLSAVIRGNMPDEDSDDESWLQWYGKLFASFGAAMFPLVREAAGFFRTGYTTSTPISSVARDVSDMGKTWVKLAEGDIGGAEALIDTLDGVTSVVAVPVSGQVIRWFDGLMDESQNWYEATVEGKDKN